MLSVNPKTLVKRAITDAAKTSAGSEETLSKESLGSGSTHITLDGHKLGSCEDVGGKVSPTNEMELRKGLWSDDYLLK